MAIIESAPRSQQATLAAVFCFSAGPVGFAVQKYLTAWFSPFAIIAVQMLLGALALWIVLLVSPRHQVPLSDKLKAFCVGIIHPGGFMILFTAASRSLDGVTAILLSAFMSAVVGILARIFLQEPLKPITLFGMAVCFAGLLLVISERQVSGESTWSGYLLALFALSLAASGQIIGRRIHTRSNTPWQVVATMQVSGAAVISWLGAAVTGASFDAGALAGNGFAFLYIGLVSTAAGYFAYNFALSRMPVLQLGLIASIGPAVGAIAASIIFDSPFGLRTASGVAVIFIGTALPSLLSKIRPRNAG